MRKLTVALTCLLIIPLLSLQAAWKPADGPLMTRWAKTISPDRVHSDYPRPQMAREKWINLNGLWQYAIDIATGCHKDHRASDAKGD